ncbi:MAG: hypothetical protein NVS3B14_11910 [Ktedonobacteraceae bacterium]
MSIIHMESNSITNTNARRMTKKLLQRTNTHKLSIQTNVIYWCRLFLIHISGGILMAYEVTT